MPSPRWARGATDDPASRSRRPSPSRAPWSVVVLEEPDTEVVTTDNAPWLAQRIGRVQRMDAARVGRFVQAVIDAADGPALREAQAARRAPGPSLAASRSRCRARARLSQRLGGVAVEHVGQQLVRVLVIGDQDQVRQAPLDGDASGRAAQLRVRAADDRHLGHRQEALAGVEEAVDRAAALRARGPRR